MFKEIDSRFEVLLSDAKENGLQVEMIEKAYVLAKELHIPYENVTKFGGNSVLNLGKTKGDF